MIRILVRFVYAASTVLSVTALTTFMANAQENAFADCSCVTAPADSGAGIGTIILSGGEVLYSGPSGYEPASPGAQLVSGSQITVGNNAFASISVGSSCNLNVPENTDASISQPLGADGDICVRITEQTDVAAANTPAPTVAPWVPLGVIAGGAGLALIIGGGDNAASN